MEAMKAVSRTAWESFIRCKRCFYLERKLKIKPIGMPGYPINSRVDSLLKEEFDIYREKQEPHPIFKKYNLNFVPYNLDPQKLKDYRNNRRGVEAKSKKTEFTLFGALDDLWLNKDTNEIVVLDYKATSNKNDPDYVNSSREYHKSYKRQLDFYAYLLKLNNYKIFKTGYWLICNATDENQKTFEGKLSFKITLLSYDLKTDYIEDILVELERCLKLEKPPSSGKYCSNCIWQNQVRPFKK